MEIGFYAGCHKKVTLAAPTSGLKKQKVTIKYGRDELTHHIHLGAQLLESYILKYYGARLFPPKISLK